ncbi:hypothetical protein [Rhizobium leguminosarum]|uniref:hypothetical protein n=1 Tax=Rhizobium leguminosarum TaxID=384 RepID=UPI0021BC0BF4|nr:hypothetical protein [Rhizobium leguminosarum]
MQLRHVFKRRSSCRRDELVGKTARPSNSPTAWTFGVGSAILSRIDRLAASLNDDALEAARLYSFSAKAPYSKTSASLPEPRSRPISVIAVPPSEVRTARGIVAITVIAVCHVGESSGTNVEACSRQRHKISANHTDFIAGLESASRCADRTG